MLFLHNERNIFLEYFKQKRMNNSYKMLRKAFFKEIATCNFE